MSDEKKEKRYQRIGEQLKELFAKTSDPLARMATASALLYHKMDRFFWCGFYRLLDGALTVGPYQGSLACLVLQKDTGVCWAAINRKQSVIVTDVHQFPGHIACDSRSKSEIVVPVFDENGSVVAVLDVDSDKTASFDETDRRGLEQIAALIFRE